jgi:hypothetical protein
MKGGVMCIEGMTSPNLEVRIDDMEHYRIIQKLNAPRCNHHDAQALENLPEISEGQIRYRKALPAVHTAEIIEKAGLYTLAYVYGIHDEDGMRSLVMSRRARKDNILIADRNEFLKMPTQVDEIGIYRVLEHHNSL